MHSKGLVLGLALVTTLAAFSLAACGSDDDQASEDGQSSGEATAVTPPPSGALVDEGEFTACMDISYPPMEYFEGGSDEPKGFDVAAIAALAESWGVEPVYSDVSFDGLLPALTAGRCDVVWSTIYLLPERTKEFPAVPYADSRTVLLVPAGNPGDITSLDDLSGKTIVAQTGTSLLDLANELVKKYEDEGKTPPTVQEYAKATDLIQQLVVGRADAAFTLDIEASYRETQTPGQFEIGYAYPDKGTFGIYFNRDNPELGEAIEEGMKALQEDGTLEQLAEQEGFPPEGVNVQPIVGL